MSTMKALYYKGPRDFKITQRPVPSVGPDDVLLRVRSCGICGTDAHIHEGEFIARFPVITGHEIVGVVETVGSGVKDFQKGDRCVADAGSTCGNCFYCRRGQSVLCENFDGVGCSLDGGFAEFVLLKQNKLYKIFNLTDEEATLVEPCACVVHGLDKLNAPVGVEVLMIGAGPTGLLFSQLMKLNGASKVVLAANAGQKMKLAKELDAADEYVELDRENPQAQWDKLKQDYPHGFDVVVEATGVEKVANDALGYVRRGGTLLIYGVYANSALVHWPPAKIFQDEIKIIGSFAQVHCFPRAVAYLDSGKIRVKGMVSHVFKLEEYQQALDQMASRQCAKIVLKP
ncbi:GroES-like protein [Sistotremastrum suecicum HHB10207 ss-3]|uniref:GroES-like protein n=1 Tax=Sistotremastrum suecicum HHB10207 ss-3 TaxID=1314776 RepID=A0A165ZMQ9_9AGAM|nr:GroES-like protein [Sistotremastrum suecicum HHB10207 ss-3]